eukprot:GEZU01017311.1.p3 GENE.GEZU01017311.1~~GEZU01017311.1.p3  ORF type:complete len:100 (+),score=5.45 GEZU01017311.1:292-591(+)
MNSTVPSCSLISLSASISFTFTESPSWYSSFGCSSSSTLRNVMSLMSNAMLMRILRAVASFVMYSLRIDSVEALSDWNTASPLRYLQINIVFWKVEQKL